MDLSAIPPNDIDAEAAVLGSVLLDDGALDELGDIEPAMFYRPQHGQIFEAMSAMRSRHVPIDQTTLQAELSSRGVLDKVGGLSRVLELVDAVVSAKNVAHYARIVREKWQLRQLIVSCTRLARRAHGHDEAPAELLAAAQDEILAVTNQAASSTCVEVGETLVNEILAEVDAPDQRVKTGIGRLDRVIGGIRPAEMVVIAARPSHGKSSMMTSWLRELWWKQRRRCAVFSFEVPRKQVLLNLACNIGRVSTEGVDSNDLADQERNALAEIGAEMATSGGLFVQDAAPMTVSQLVAESRMLVRRHGVEFIFVDYLQQLRGSRETRKQGRVSELEEASAALKLSIARHLEVNVVALAQINRDGDKGRGRPRMSDIKGCGQIEQDADVILIVHRPERDKPNDPALRGLADVWVDKNRNGKTGKAELRFADFCRSFEDN